MANEWILHLGVTGQESLAASLKTITRELNDAEKASMRQKRVMEATARFRERSASLARQERRDAFDRLSSEQKLLRLQQQREKIVERLARAQGNDLRTAALRLRLAQIDPAIRGLGGGGGGGFLGGAMGGMLGRGGGGGMLSRLVPGLGAAFGVTALYQQVRGLFGEADMLSDLAEQYGMKRSQLFQVRRGGELAGVREETALSGISNLELVRSKAMGGDKDSLKLLGAYGVNPQQLNGGATSLDVGLQIRRTLGREGATAADAGAMAEIFGERWRQSLSVLTAIAQMPQEAAKDIERDIAAIDQANVGLESLQHKTKDKFRSVVAWLLRGGKANREMKATAPSSTVLGIPDQRTVGSIPGLNSDRAVNEAFIDRAGGVIPSADALTRVGGFTGMNEFRPKLQMIQDRLVSIDRGIRELNTEAKKEYP